MNIDKIHDRLRAMLLKIEEGWTRPQADQFADLYPAVHDLLGDLRSQPWGIHQAADYLGVSKAWLEERAKAGEVGTVYGDKTWCTFTYPELRSYKDRCNSEASKALDEVVRIGEEAGFHRDDESNNRGHT